MAQKTTRLKKYLTIGAVGVVLLAHQNCTYNMGAGVQKGAVTELSAVTQNIIPKDVAEVLQARCYSCHNPEKPEGEISDITDINTLKYYRLVIPGEPQISPLYREIVDGNMPPSGGMAQSEIDMIYKWINNDLVKDVAGVTPPSGASAILEAKWASIYIKIVQPRCMSCHNSTDQSGGVNLSNYNSAMNTIQAGNPNASSFYTSTANGSMPARGSLLSPSELSTIRDWIMNGALNN